MCVIMFVTIAPARGNDYSSPLPLPLSSGRVGVSHSVHAEAVDTFGPVRNPSATKGHENLFVGLPSRKRVDGSTLCMLQKRNI